MFPRKLTNLIAAALYVCIVFTSPGPVALAQKKTAPVEATPPPLREEFKFGEVDLEVLEQADLLDVRLERDGLVLADESANAYLRRIGQSLIPSELKLERVKWRFRALRDPQPNAFALPNGSIYVTTGLINLLDNESQLAAIIAHELTHVMRRHTYVHNRSNRKKFLTMNVMSAVGAYAPGGLVGAVITIVTTVAPFIMIATSWEISRATPRFCSMSRIAMRPSSGFFTSAPGIVAASASAVVVAACCAA
mgnify:CR=1 FL=1